MARGSYFNDLNQLAGTYQGNFGAGSISRGANTIYQGFLGSPAYQSALGAASRMSGGVGAKTGRQLGRLGVSGSGIGALRMGAAAGAGGAALLGLQGSVYNTGLNLAATNANAMAQATSYTSQRFNPYEPSFLQQLAGYGLGAIGAIAPGFKGAGALFSARAPSDVSPPGRQLYNQQGSEGYKAIQDYQYPVA